MIDIQTVFPESLLLMEETVTTGTPCSFLAGG
jgi:hypothetical protein